LKVQTATKKRNRLTGHAVTLLVWLKGAWDAVDEFLREQREVPRSHFIPPWRYLAAKEGKLLCKK
jgi:hypothetical protein